MISRLLAVQLPGFALGLLVAWLLGCLAPPLCGCTSLSSSDVAWLDLLSLLNNSPSSFFFCLSQEQRKEKQIKKNRRNKFQHSITCFFPKVSSIAKSRVGLISILLLVAFSPVASAFPSFIFFSFSHFLNCCLSLLVFSEVSTFTRRAVDPVSDIMAETAPAPPQEALHQAGGGQTVYEDRVLKEVRSSLLQHLEKIYKSHGGECLKSPISVEWSYLTPPRLQQSVG